MQQCAAQKTPKRPHRMAFAAVAFALAPLLAAAAAADEWVSPADFFGDGQHNGGTLERLTVPAAGKGKQPHIWMLLFDDYGWADAGWHRGTITAGVKVAATPEVQTPNLNAMVKEGIELDRACEYIIMPFSACCAP